MTIRLGPPVPNALRNGLPKRFGSTRVGRHVAVNVSASFTVRPYTLRKGDTVESIADKRGFEISELKKLNHQVNLSKLEEGQTILLPSVALSERDKEIISGIGWRYRTYPVRKGETIDEIISKRGITMAEMEKLNPDVDLKKLKAYQVIKLPSGKYTVREREMLMGVAGVPREFFQNKGAVGAASVFAVVAVVGAIAWWKERSGEDT